MSLAGEVRRSMLSTPPVAGFHQVGARARLRSSRHHIRRVRQLRVSEGQNCLTPSLGSFPKDRNGRKWVAFGSGMARMGFRRSMGSVTR